MSLLSWFDNRTLFGCQCMLAIMFAVVFLWMGRAYPSVRGIRSMALGFLAGIPCTLCMVSRGHISFFVSVVLGNFFAIACFLWLYDGIVTFIGGRKHLRFLIPLSAISLAVVFYYCQIQPQIVPRILAMALPCALVRALTAWELFRLAPSSPNRGTMRFLGGFLTLTVLVGLQRMVVTALYGAPQNFLQRNAEQTSTMAMNVAFVGITGLCFLLMASHEMITRSTAASEHDLLSGVFNRRGIESRLAEELKRAHRSQLPLSIALIDIDHFKRINDTHGHAAGDAVIRRISASLASQLRGSDAVGRYGGDEFLVILPHTAAHQALIVAERLRQAVQCLPMTGISVQVTLSLGITEAVRAEDAPALITRADEALYEAKNSGRDCLRVFMPPHPASESLSSDGQRITATSA